MIKIKRVLESVVDYLKEDEVKNLTSLRKEFRDQYAHHASQLVHDFHKIEISDPAIKGYIKQILQALGVEDERFENAKLTVYDFFLELNRYLKHITPLKNTSDVDNQKALVAIETSKREKIENIITLVKEQDKTLKRLLIIGSAVTIVILSTIGAILFAAPASVSFFNALLTSAMFVSGVGLVFALGVAAYSFFQSNRSANTPFIQRFTDNFLLLSSTALNTAAYSVLLAASVSMNPVAAILFVVAAVTDFIKELANFMRLSFESDSTPKEQGSTSELYQSVRHQNERLKSRNSFFINTMVAAAVVGIMAFWCFSPPTLMITVGSIVALGIVSLVRLALNFFNRKWMNEKLEKDFSKIDSKEELNPKNASCSFKRQPEVHKPALGLGSQPPKHSKALANASNYSEAFSIFSKKNKGKDDNSSEVEIEKTVNRQV